MQKYLRAEDREERGSRTKIAMLNFKQNAPIERIDFTNINDLAKGLSRGNEMDDDIHARLYVVEDLSRNVIEALGSHFDVDPHLFRGHISHYMCYNSRDPWVELPDLDIVSRKRSYFHVRYVQSRYFRDQFSLSEAKRETGGFNVLRKMDRDDNWVPNFEIPNSDVGLVRSKTSLWIRPSTENEKGVLGKFTRATSITDKRQDTAIANIFLVRHSPCQPHSNEWLSPMGWLPQLRGLPIYKSDLCTNGTTKKFYI